MAEEIKSVTLDLLKDIHGADAKVVYDKIAQIGGFGNFGHNYMNGQPPLLDVSDIQDPEAKKQIFALLKKGDK